LGNYIPKDKTINSNYNRERMGAELSFNYDEASLRAEYLTGRDRVTDKSGYYVQLGYYVISKKLQAVFKYDSYDPDTNADDNESVLYVLGANYNFTTSAKLQVNYNIATEAGGNSSQINNNYLALQFQIGF
jgi:hypothetical protein